MTHKEPSASDSFSWDALVPAYNAADTIMRTIQSARTQTIPATRILVFDDGSHDGTAQIARAAGAEVITEGGGRNMGVGHARNELLNSSSSEWILILDADDALLPGATEVIRDALIQAEHVDCLSFQSVELSEGALLKAQTGEMLPRPLTHGDLLSANKISSSAAIIRREAAIRVGFRPLRRLVDYDFWLRLARSGGRIAQHSGTVCARLVSRDSITASVDAAVISEAELLAREYRAAGAKRVPVRREVKMVLRGLSRHIDYGKNGNEYLSGSENLFSKVSLIVLKLARAHDALLWRTVRRATRFAPRSVPHV